MPPKKGKGRKRATTEDTLKDKQTEELLPENTDLLSPSEVVKMRKKARNSASDTSDTGKEKDQITPVTKVKLERRERGQKKDTIKEEKKKEFSVRNKKGKLEKENDGRKNKIIKEKKTHWRKKTKPDENDDQKPVLYPCGICTKEVSDADDAILCEAGCEYWYHRHCTGMTDIAYQLLTNEENAEWVCDKCIATKSVPLVKIKDVEAVS